MDKLLALRQPTEYDDISAGVFTVPDTANYNRRNKLTKRNGMEWVTQHFKDNFDNAIWSETSVSMGKKFKRRYYSSKAQKTTPKLRHPLKLPVWAGIGRK